ncbi:MAG TPA: dihydroorotase [Prolixibacteraceae bacterium]|nr:dihydroorotase [Prolixibacteraceae bacterium]
MPTGFIIKNAEIINEGERFTGQVVVEGELISRIIRGPLPEDFPSTGLTVVDATGLYLIPGVIDDQVHFREPGLTHKGDISSESRAAVAGGVTSFMDMPNTLPQTVTQELLEEKYQRAAEVSVANYSFLMGTTNDNLEEVLKTDPSRVCGIKVFLGASTGNMLVDRRETLAELFRQAPTLIAVHCEDETVIRARSEEARARFGEEVPFSWHPVIRDAEACYRSSASAVELASRYGTRLHVFHLSTAREMDLFQPGDLRSKNITAEVCVHHLWFTDQDYSRLGSRIKWNPAIKSAEDREALWTALLNDRLDVVATDHAPHTLQEKSQPYFKAPSGAPLVQHSLQAMLEMSLEGRITIEQVVRKMCHAPADLFRITRRGYIREGYYADLVLVNPGLATTVTPENILYKCGWSPLEGVTFGHTVTHTFVNGQLAWSQNRINPDIRGMRLLFD